MKVKVGLETVVSVLPETVFTAKDQAYLEPMIPDDLRSIAAKSPVSTFIHL
jgi:hypothetical protein